MSEDGVPNIRMLPESILELLGYVEVIVAECWIKDKRRQRMLLRLFFHSFSLFGFIVVNPVVVFSNTLMMGILMNAHSIPQILYLVQNHVLGIRLCLCNILLIL